MKMLIIEWQRLLDERNKTCPRCGSTEQEVEKAVLSLKQTLKSAGIDVSLVKKAINPQRFKKDVLQSNKILIAGKTLEEWLGAGTGQSPCCEVCGDAECRTVEYADQTHETIPADLIVKAGLLATTQVFNVKLPQVDQRKSAINILAKKC
ncbi:MAG: ribonuclease [Nitrospirae bacterium]|nr:ribonuclease [Nitrospirota bacterium]